MIVFELIQELEKGNMLKPFVRNGIVASKIFRYYEVYIEYDKLKKTTKKGKMDRVSELSDKFRLSERTIQSIVKQMEDTIERSLI